METLSVDEGTIKDIKPLGGFVNLLTLDNGHDLEETLVFDYVSRDFIGLKVRIESRAIHSGLFCVSSRAIDQDIYFGENPEPVRVRVYSRNVRKYFLRYGIVL